MSDYLMMSAYVLTFFIMLVQAWRKRGRYG